MSSAFLKTQLPAFARAHPQIEIRVSPRPATHPIIRGSYINGREKVVCVRNLSPPQILGKAELLREASGDKLRTVTRPVASGGQDSVRGVWSGLHSQVQARAYGQEEVGAEGEKVWRI